jgi:hypothetical protein
LIILFDNQSYVLLKLGACVLVADFVQLIDEPGQGRWKAEQTRIDTVYECHCDRVQRADYFLPVLLRLELVLLGARMAKPWRNYKKLNYDMIYSKKMFKELGWDLSKIYGI